MIFPNGQIKEGYFENNIFKGKNKPEETVLMDNEVRLNTKIDTIEQESLWEKYGQKRQTKGSSKKIGNVPRTGNGWYGEEGGFPDINNSAYENDGYGYNMMNATDPTGMKKRKDNSGSRTQISFTRGRTKYTSESKRNAHHSTKRPRIATANTSIMQKRRNLNTTSTDVKRKRTMIPPKYPKTKFRK